MFKPLPALAASVVAATVSSVPTDVALAQQSDTAPAAPSPSTPAPPPGAPAPTAARPLPPMPPGVVATVNNPNLAVANVRLGGGLRLGRLIGAPVQNEQGERIGNVDDLVLAQDNRVSLAVISVGGFLGLGSKLVAVP